MSQGLENMHFSETSIKQFWRYSFFVLPLNGMLQVWSCLEFAALKEAWELLNGVSTYLYHYKPNGFFTIALAYFNLPSVTNKKVS